MLDTVQDVTKSEIFTRLVTVQDVQDVRYRTVQDVRYCTVQDVRKSDICIYG